MNAGPRHRYTQAVSLNMCCICVIINPCRVIMAPCLCMVEVSPYQGNTDQLRSEVIPCPTLAFCSNAGPCHLFRFVYRDEFFIELTATLSTCAQLHFIGRRKQEEYALVGLGTANITLRSMSRCPHDQPYAATCAYLCAIHLATPCQWSDPRITQNFGSFSPNP